ncbi:MAG: multidrug efflux MFS transporter [Chloroflexi bacterium]|nr:multidrug efflux MFS transporter [Chloroflexota bacterium]
MNPNPYPDSSPSQPWRRNLTVLFMVQLCSAAGFSLVFPFLPLYVKELGSVSGGSVALWSSLVFSVQAFTMMISAPIWGVVADRYGRKLMLARATLGGAVLLAAMGFAQNAEQLVLLRAIQGAVTGVMTATFTLVAVGTPKSHTGFALGTINMARWIGFAGGPVVGGFIGEHVGFRESFWFTGALLGLAGLAVLLFVHEDFQPPDQVRRLSFWASYRSLLRAPAMVGLYSLTFLNSFGRSLIMPILALFVLALLQGQVAGSASLTGLIIGVSALTSALSAIYWGRVGDRVGHDRIFLFSAGLVALLYLPQALVTAPWQLILLQALTGAAAGGLIPSVASLLNEWTPPGNQGATYGLDNSVRAGARSVAPLIAASLAMWVGYRGVFVGAAGVYAVMTIIGVLLWRRRQVAAQMAKPA